VSPRNGWHLVSGIATFQELMQGRRMFTYRHLLTLMLSTGLGLSASWMCDANPADAVGVSLSHPTAVELKSQLAGVSGPGLLETLGIEQSADMSRALPIPMRDGVLLAATVIRPRDRPTDRLPVILIRTPYKVSDELSAPLAARLIPDLLRNHYVIVLVNDRGTQWSQGTYHFLKGANRDGYDILDWIVKQPWSDGKVGTYGCSSSAESQLGLSTLNHPAHKAMVEIAGATGLGRVRGYDDSGMYYVGGIPAISWAFWYRTFGHFNHPQLPTGITLDERARVAASYSPEPVYGMGDMASLAGHLPSEDILRAVDTPETEWEQIIRRSPASPEWLDYDLIRDGDKTSVPGLHMGSWYDIEAYPTTKLYEHFQASSSNQYFVMGGTAHCMQGSETADTSVGGTSVGDARFDYAGLVERWFDHWLKNDTSAIAKLPQVQYYLLNSNQWQSTDQWPPANLRSVKLYLQSQGHANSRLGDGTLSETAPGAKQPADEFIYDPLHPAPAGGDLFSGNMSQEQAPVESRQDVLVYTTAPFASAVRLVGDIDVTFSVSSSVPDTDLILRLVDVHPDGRAFNLTETGQRLRYRDGIGQPTMMQSGHIYRTTIGGLVTATQLGVGHRLRIQVTGSSFPTLERNMNTGRRNFDETEPVIARTRIYHDGANPSFITYSVLPSP
jgi:putative CocE/NonD family hydrolase